MSKRYQVFVSSTYADLKEERQKVMQALMELDCIPAGMELFPAADEEQFEFIKRVIDDCDYYLLIIGGRYGSLSKDGISFTEQEFEYAISRGLRVIAMLHESPDEISFGKSEQDPDLRARLQSFRTRASTDRLVRFWKQAEELPGLVALSLSKTIKMYPAVGWIRVDKVSSEDLLSEINQVRKDNAALARRVAVAENNVKQVATVVNLAGLNDSFEVNGKGYYQTRPQSWTAMATWSELFAFVAPYLLRHPSEAIVKDVYNNALADKSKSSLTGMEILDQGFQTIGVQLRALGLIEISYAKTFQGGMDLFWNATGVGEVLTLELRTIRSTA